MEEKSTATLEKIQQAAMEEFTEKGFQGASLRQIVKQAGVTTGALYELECCSEKSPPIPRNALRIFALLYWHFTLLVRDNATASHRISLICHRRRPYLCLFKRLFDLF